MIIKITESESYW